MELLLIRGGTKEELETRQYNIGVGISLGNKWFTPENIFELVKWSLKHTKEKTIVYVADTLHCINIEVRNKKSRETALTIAKKQGQKILNNVYPLINSLPIRDQNKLCFATWDDITNNNEYQEKVDWLYSFYKSNESFRTTILGIIKNFVSNKQGIFDNDEMIHLGNYVIEELPELLCRVRAKDVVYDAYAYPHDTDITRLVEKIQKEKIFPEIKKKIMDTSPKVFLEVR